MEESACNERTIDSLVPTPYAIFLCCQCFFKNGDSLLVLFKRELTRKVHSDSCSFLHAKAELVGYDGGGGNI